MKKGNKITASIIAAALLAIPFVPPSHSTFAAALKNEQTQKGTKQSVSEDLSAWDKSSLSFTAANETSDSLTATIKNGQGSGAMKGEVNYEVYWSANGNPKDGEVIATGVVKALASGETQVLTYQPDQLAPGNYMFKAYQRPNHPGSGELWSESITVYENPQTNQQVIPQRPLDQFFHASVKGGEATFTVPAGMEPIQISFTSYAYPEGIVPQADGEPYAGQTAFKNVTKVYGPGTYTVDVDLPNGYFQTDLYLGPKIEKLTASGHPMDKIIAANVGSNN
ncbi:hypothetical protein [Neobacillus cucumis]|uniref:hypothetical protein n=1 Tax=Neobacillus cucumis TaxID=1740721 RepID=UPI00285326F9|nr:hypothetical protein [Neobacillus cucumis]MDR4945190.1 hypothetical protein [Neobacillus cucumis]